MGWDMWKRFFNSVLFRPFRLFIPIPFLLDHQSILPLYSVSYLVGREMGSYQLVSLLCEKTLKKDTGFNLFSIFAGFISNI